MRHDLEKSPLHVIPINLEPVTRCAACGTNIDGRDCGKPKFDFGAQELQPTMYWEEFEIPVPRKQHAGACGQAESRTPDLTMLSGHRVIIRFFT